VTALSYRLLEQPIRHNNQRLIDSLAVAVSVAGVLAALVVAVPQPQRGDHDALHRQGDSGLVDFASSVPGVPPASSPAASSTSTSAPPKPAILVVGSEPVAAEELLAAGANVIDRLRSDCLVLGAPTPVCPDPVTTWVEEINRAHPAMLVVSIGNAERSASVDGVPVEMTTYEGTKRQIQLLNQRINELLDQLTASTTVPLVLSDRAPAGNFLDQGIGLAADAHAQVAVARSTTELLRVTGMQRSADVPTVMVIGDSTSLDLARAMNSVAGGRVAVVWAGVLNCPFSPIDGQRSESGSPWNEKSCANYLTKLPPLIERYRPDVIVMLAGLGELWQMRYLDGTSSEGPADANFAVQHDRAIDELFALFGARPVLIGDSPDLSARGLIPGSLITDERVGAYNAQVARWIAAHPTARLLPYRQIVEDYEA
ncbi:MAG TPA: SGNH hydrolase domain-containing protein, partial [Ilumatobacteraceae bacterium]|nr:SGNH hydrolase domain-containing protein [Ilumatobacteraceae bacterium]